MLLPILAGVGALALLLGASKKKTPQGVAPNGDLPVPEAKKLAAVKKTVAAVKAEDWQGAVVAALESGSAATVGALAKKLRAAGKTAEAVALLRSFQELQDVANDPEDVPDPDLPLDVPSVPVSADDEDEDDDEEDEDDDEDDDEDEEDDEDDDVVPPVSDLVVQALQLRSALTMSSRYKEDRALVEQWQRKVGATPDGMYGTGTARTLYVKAGIVPPNPFYFSANKASAAAQVREYKKWLAGVIEELRAKGEQAEVTLGERLMVTVGR